MRKNSISFSGRDNSLSQVENSNVSFSNLQKDNMKNSEEPII